MSQAFKITREQMVHTVTMAWLNGVATGGATTAGRAGIADELAGEYGESLALTINDDPIARMQVEQMLSDWLDGKSDDALSTMTVFKRGGES